MDVVKWSYAVGHVFNDLCASLWFLFTLPYLTNVLQLDNGFAGDILLIGQIADAISTPAIGIESDQVGLICAKRLGKRKSWHLFGSILSAISFPFIFNSFFNRSNTVEWYIVIYYTPFVVIFQFAWATIQVTHLSLIPILVREGHDNSTLNSLRYMFTVISNVLVLTASTLLFKFNKLVNPGPCNGFNSTIQPSPLSITPCDQTNFTYLTLGVVGIGLIFTLLFHFNVPENKYNEDSVSEDSVTTPLLLVAQSNDMTKADWFKEPQFYLVNALYLATRLIVNISQVYLVIFVTDTLGMTKSHGSIAALTTFLVGAVTSIVLKSVQSKIGTKICYLIGLVVISFYCTYVSFLYYHISLIHLYASMVILGCGCSIIMIGSLSITSELIGNNCRSSAFVYGCMSFSDKLFNGLCIWFLQRFAPSRSSNHGESYHIFVKDIQLYFIGACVLFGLCIWCILLFIPVGVLKKSKLVINQPVDEA